MISKLKSAEISADSSADDRRPESAASVREERKRLNSKTTMRGREYGLILGQIFLEYFSNSRSLHYGLWSDDLELNVYNIGKAQEAYTDLLISCIPSNVRTILDVGSGVGAVASRLLDLNYDVQCLSPSTMLNAEARKTVPGIVVYDSSFEEFKADRRYDLILFAESFQYVDPRVALSKASEMLTPAGVIIVCDKFKCEEKGKSPIGGGHPFRDYLAICKELGFTTTLDVDLTDRIAPNFDLLQDFRMRVIEPFAEKIDEITTYKLSFTKYIFLHALRKVMLRNLAKHRKPDRNAKGFKLYNTYRLNVLKPSGPNSDRES